MAGNGITRNQNRAITALLANATVTDAAAQTGIGHRTLCRWLAEDNAFQAALAQAEGRAIDAATRHLVSLADQAINVLRQTMLDDEVSATVRVRAAQSVLDHLLKLRELRNVEQRLTKLEEALYAGSEKA